MNADEERRPAPALQWRLHTVMSERGIRTAAELHRRLQPYGLDITLQQLSRIVAHLPQRLNTTILSALLTALECDAGDLLRLPKQPALARRRAKAAPAAAAPRPLPASSEQPHSPASTAALPPGSPSAAPDEAAPTTPKQWDVCGPNVDALSRGFAPKAD